MDLKKIETPETPRGIQRNSGKTVCEAFARAGIEPRGVVAGALYPAKKKFEGFCPECRANVTGVTVRMLRAGNRNCLCTAYSLHGLDPHTSPPAQIARRIDALGIVREAGLKAFSSTFFEAMGRERLHAVIACSDKMNVVRKHKTKLLSKEDLLAHLGESPDRPHMNRNAFQAYKNYLAKGGTNEELVATHPHLALRRRPVTDAERDVKENWKIFAERVKTNPHYSLHNLQSEYRGARLIYKTVCKRGIPVQLVFMNATRFYLKVHSGINFPRDWVLDCPLRYLARLKACARTARKALALEEPHVAFTAKHLDAKEGKVHLQALVSEVIEKFALHDQALVDKLLARSPGLDWHRLSVHAQKERVREELLAQIGFPKTLLYHQDRETQVSEVVATTLKLGIGTHHAFREHCRPFYNFLRDNGFQDLFLIEMGWAGAYVAVHADVVCHSEFEAIVANLLALTGTSFLHDKTYPHQGGTSYRYDFFLQAASVYVEVYMFRRDSIKAAPGRHRHAPAYIKARAKKEKLHADQALSVVPIEIEDFYGEADRSRFAHYAYTLLLESGGLAAALSAADLKRCLNVHQSQVDPAEAEHELASRLVALGVSDPVAAAVVARIADGMAQKTFRLTAPASFGIADFDAAGMFSGIHRAGNAFTLARMARGVVRRERFPDFRYGHWALALAAAISKREMDPSLWVHGKSLGKAPKTGVWYLRVRNKQVSVDKAVTGHAASLTISGGSLPDKIRTGLQIIASKRGELLLTEPLTDAATSTEVDRQFRISVPTHADIDILTRLIVQRLQPGEG